MSRLIDRTGERYGRLIVIKYVGHSKWLCKCDCGNEIEEIGSSLGKHTVSCGCKHRDNLLERNTKHGFAVRGEQTSLYKRWRNMKKRANNKNDKSFKHYGGRGIKICDDWYDYPKFREWALSSGYRDDLTIDRIDVDGGYCPENCTKARILEQEKC